MLVTRFWRSTSGNFAMMFAVSLPVMLTGVGFALDVSNLMSAKSSLQNALDSAVLAASRLADKSTSRDDLFDGYFKANTNGQGSLVNPSAHLTVEQGVNYIKTTATATAEVALNFSFVFGKSGHLSVKASAYESTAKLEVAMVLDNTGSMGDANMKALRDGATQLVNILKQAKTEKPEREIRVALVPFVTAVNINGVGFKDEWIDKRTIVPKDDKSTNGNNFATYADGRRYGHWDLFVNKLKVEWKGCVEARTSKFNADGTPNLTTDALNLDDTPPAKLVYTAADQTGNVKPETVFVPYFAPDEPGAAKASPNSATAFNNSYLSDGNKAATKVLQKTQQMAVAKYSNVSIRNTAVINTAAPATTGPNYACPTPIAPLTTDLESLKTDISKMVYWYGSGTNVSEGLAWGYRVLSPGEPYDQGDAFNSDQTSKVVVVFTDGENNVFGASSELANQSDYGAYGYFDTYRMGTSSSTRATALTNVNTWTDAMCTRLKNQGVKVFTVVLGADTAANRKLYSGCASTPANYYPTKDATQLKAAFDNIAYAITDLYVTN
ncbi:VWA domain-containing protein [Mesorhizobium sp. CGMCC 1.15528]|uniref:VWA domain-containing protein n=1 Tax=Mesorhizobium zhangyense TaxID=1776730 RepID=A0A7C9R5T0_9HYPH|nr:pilus assembly protein [Mesorhizobium zhangyense]NGN40735.1 VWA domain-containing protein [Mesorhizobium zhangyense]